MLQSPFDTRTLGARRWNSNGTLLRRNPIWKSTAEAISVFGDQLEITIPDPDHSESEFRFLSLGCSDQGRLLVVAYTERQGRVRLISAREAAPRERKKYGSEQFDD